MAFISIFHCSRPHLCSSYETTYERNLGLLPIVLASDYSVTVYVELCCVSNQSIVRYTIPSDSDTRS